MIEHVHRLRSTGWASWLAKLVAILLALTVVAILVAWIAARPSQTDAFYDAEAPADAAPGTLLRSERFTLNVPTGATGWRILYVTTGYDSTPSIASAVVVAPPANGSQVPVIAWAHGTTGVAAGCAPSVMANAFDNVPGIAEIIKQNWAYVGTDYAGLGTGGGHAYLIGETAAHNVLDAVRAAGKLEGLALARDAVVWGHSQGGNSALWTGAVAASYAPEIRVLGVGALAPASDLVALVQKSRSSLFGKIVSAYLLAAYRKAYPDVAADVAVHRHADMLGRDIATRCVGGLKTLFSVAEALLMPAEGIFSADPTQGAMGARLAQNTPVVAEYMPTLIAQGLDDDLVLPSIQQGYAKSQCAKDRLLDYREYQARDHLSLVADGSPLITELLKWTGDRFAGVPAQAACR
jgi:hypothetical protein